MSITPISSGELASIPVTVIRGGTSKGVFLFERDLPDDRSQWGPFLIALFGSSDATQIDGLGGGRPTTSKCCIIGPATVPGADVDYTFAQVGIGEQKVYWDFNCGNLTPAVGVFAVLAGVVPNAPGTATVRINQTNTKMMLGVDVPTDAGGAPVMDGPYEIAGVWGSAAQVMTDFSATVGASLGGELLPTGRRADVLHVPERGDVRCSILDVANMCVFFRAEDAGLDGLEHPDRGPEVVSTFTAVRHAAQALLGIDPHKTTPWPVSVTAPRAYTSLDGRAVRAADYDLAVRFAGIQPMRDTMHEAFPGTASCCTGVAAATLGTVVHDIVRDAAPSGDVVRIGHASGVMPVEARVHDERGRCVIDRAAFARTVRPIMQGDAFLRRSALEGLLAAIAVDDPVRAGVPAPTTGPLGAAS